MLKNTTSANTSLGILAGFILALMIFFNGSLAKYVHPYWSSAIVHGVGFIFGMLLFPFFPIKRPEKSDLKQKLSWWNFLGGVSGGVTVILASTAINSNLGVSGTISFMLFGQMLFSLLADQFGILGLKKRAIEKKTIIQLTFLIAGCGLIFISQNGNH